MTTAEAAPLIELRNVSKRFAGVQALSDVSLSCPAGKVVCLLGDNGAGKSTLIKILSGFHPPTSGTILLDGVETAVRRPARRTEPAALRPCIRTSAPSR